VKQGKPDKIQSFEFRHVDWTEGEMLKAQYKEDDFAPLVSALDDAVKALRADDGVTPMNVSITMPEQTINLPEANVVVEPAKAELPVNVVVQPADVPVSVNVDVNPTPVTIENEIIVPEDKPKKTIIKRDSAGNMVELESEVLTSD